MADIATVWDFANARGDWQVQAPTPPTTQVLLLAGGGPLELAGGGDLLLHAKAGGTAAELVSNQDLFTAVLISIFTDRVAAADDVIPDGTTDPRGWWGDAGQVYPIGSRLWLLGRAKATNATLLAAKGYIVEALQWLLDDGVAAAIDVVCQWTAATMLGALVTLTQPSGPPKVFSFANVWSQLS